MAGAIPNTGERSDAGAGARKRTLVLEGTFSIEEIDVSSTSRKTAAAKSRKKTGKKAVRKKAPAKKTAAKRAAAKKTAAKTTVRKKQARKKAGGAKKVARKAPARAAAKPAAPSAQETSSIVLGSRPDIKTIGELRKELGAALASDGEVVVEAGGVETIDTAALQLLAAFANSVRAKSRAVRWNDVSQPLRELAELTDLTSALGFDAGADEDDGLLPVF